MKAYQFNPGCGETPRLARLATMYARYRFRKVSFKYHSGSGTATTGSVAIGVATGTTYAEVKDANTVLKLQPSAFGAAWKNLSLTLPRSIDSQKWYRCSENSIDGVSFTFYVNADAANLGRIEVTYEVEFGFPHPF